MNAKNTPEKPRRLGRGLEALIGASAAHAETGTGAKYRRIPVAAIRPNPFQPRREFPPAELAELEASIRAGGLLQPITVRPAAEPGTYELVAGERRFRAVGSLGWTEIPAIVHDLDDQGMLTLALIENLQRTDLNPIEEAEGYQRLAAEFQLSQQQIAELVGKDRTTVANAIRILALPAAVRRMLQQGEITQGHARALLPLEREHLILDHVREITAKQLSVREVERRVREAIGRHPRTAPPAPRSGTRASQAPEARRLADELRRYLQTDVHLVLETGSRGEIRIRFYSADDLDRLLQLITHQRQES